MDTERNNARMSFISKRDLYPNPRGRPYMGHKWACFVDKINVQYKLQLNYFFSVNTSSYNFLVKHLDYKQNRSLLQGISIT